MFSFLSIFVLFTQVTAADYSSSDIQSIIGQTPFYGPCGVSSGPTVTGALTSGSSVYILGDSITERSQSEYQSVFQTKGINTNIDAQVGRSLTSSGTASENPGVASLTTGMQAIANDTAQIKQAGAIVIALGTNGGNTPQSIDQAVAAIKADNQNAPIYWVDTIVVDKPSYAPTINQANQAIYSQEQTDNYQIVSWFKTVDPAGNPVVLTGAETDSSQYIDNSDGLGVHPDGAGIQALTNLVLNAVTGSDVASSATASTSQSCTCSTGNVSLVGNDNEQQAFNYFVSLGLSSIQSAGVIGNLMQESSVNPEANQSGKPNPDPSSAGSGGWGIAQWTPGSKVIGIAQSLNITGPIEQLSTQLQIVWGEMNGTSPTGIQDLNTGLKQISDVNQATEYFEQDFEEGPIAATGAGQLAQRQKYAQDALQQYGGGGTTSGATGSTNSGNCGSTSTAINCSGASVSGNAAIACDALKYDTLSYSEGWHSSGSKFHQRCPTIGPSCATDCSGLVNIAIYDVFNNDINDNTYGEVSDTKDFQEINFSEIKPGDLIQPNPGHVEIIESVSGNTINTFGAHTNNVPNQADEVGPAQYTESPDYVFLRYIGGNQ